MRQRKHVLCPERLRHVPRQFSWIDQRLVREGHISHLSHPAQGLYLLLVTVADAEGLSYYSDATAARLLDMDGSMLGRARRELLAAGLIAYQSPLYQVLSLDPPAPRLSTVRAERSRRGSGEAVSIGEVLRQIAGGAK